MVVKVADKSGRVSSNVSASAKVLNSKLILGGSIHSGWNLSGFQWQNYNNSWQLYGADTTHPNAISQSTYNLSSYNYLSFNIWTEWWSAAHSSYSTVSAYICSTTSNCIRLWYKQYSYSTSHQKSDTVNVNISSYTGNYYVKFMVSQPVSLLTNIVTVYLKP